MSSDAIALGSIVVRLYEDGVSSPLPGSLLDSEREVFARLFAPLWLAFTDRQRKELHDEFTEREQGQEFNYGVEDLLARARR